MRLLLLVIALAGCLSSREARAQIVFSEIMYHPVEEPAFHADGSPVLDLYEDVHEFVEVHNAGTAPVDLSGWQIAGGVRYAFPPNSAIQPGAYRVIAKNPGRLAAVPAYGLALPDLFGPYTNQLGNAKDTLRLLKANGELADAVS